MVDFLLFCILLRFLFQNLLNNVVYLRRFIWSLILRHSHVIIIFKMYIIELYIQKLYCQTQFITLTINIPNQFRLIRRKKNFNHNTILMEINIKPVKIGQSASPLTNSLSFKSSNIQLNYQRRKKTDQKNNMQNVRKRLQQQKEQLQIQISKVNKQMQLSQQQKDQKIKKQRMVLQICKQKRVDIIPRQNSSFGNSRSSPEQSQQNTYYKSRDNFNVQKKFKFEILSTAVFYPPSCAAFDITYSKGNESVYVYGGISCTTDFQQGLKQYFYQLQQNTWKQIKPVSLYSPTPRYGHTLTATPESLLLFGGVSEYKEKLKDRCFYPDVWSFNTLKNNWKVLQFSGPIIKNRKSHSACIYNKFYIVYGGIDDTEQVICDIQWVNYEQKKSRWRSKKIQGRFNHQMAIIQTQHGLDYLFIFGGRNQNSQIIGQLLIYPIYISQGELQFQQPTKVNSQVTPCQFPIMKPLQNGVLIMGGINSNNDAVDQCWYYDMSKQMLEEIKSGIEWNQLRGAKAVSINGKSVYVLAGANSKKYKGVKISIQSEVDQQFRFKI